MVPVAEFLELDLDAREGKFPFIWAVDKKNRLMRLLVTKELIKSAEERLHFWRQLRGLAGAGAEAADAAEVESRVREELLAKISAALGQGGCRGGGWLNRKSRRWRYGEFDGGRWRLRTGLDRIARVHGLRRVHHAGAEDFRLQRAEAGRGHQSQRAAKFADIVKAAEKCTAGCIHPGTPWNMSEPGVEKLMARAAKFN
jgi:pyruvate-ferredoxin/flavodoxin oxidoreductase